MQSISLPAALKEATQAMESADDELDAAKEAFRQAQSKQERATRNLKDLLMSSAFAQARASNPWTGMMSIDGIAVYRFKVVVSVGYYSEDSTRPVSTVRVEFTR